MPIELLRSDDAERAQRRAAGALRARGLRAGDRVAVIAGEAPSTYVAVALGALRTGVVPVLLNPALLSAEQEVLLEDAQPSLVLRDADLQALLDGPETDLAPAPLARPMLYTSGTTGRPKGVWSGVLGEADAAALLEEERALWGFHAGDVHLVASSLYHSAPLRFAAGTLLAGGDVVFLGGFDAGRMKDAIARFRPTTTFVAPAHLQRLFAAGELPSLASFRLVAHAGAPCPDPLKHEALRRFPEGAVWEFYGSTEGQFTACPPADWLAHPGTVGRARANRALSIHDGGMIWCTVPRWARFEYWRDPEKTARAWRDDAFSVFDLGSLDADGFLYLDGRRDDLIITGGVNVYPLEVERALLAHAGVRDVAVFPIDDERWGQMVCAALVGDASDAALDAWLADRIAPYKRPKRYYRVDAIPHTPTGKVRRGRLAADLGLARDVPRTSGRQ